MKKLQENYSYSGLKQKNLFNIDFSDIIILFDINYSVLNLENSIQSLLNKYIYYYFKN